MAWSQSNLREFKLKESEVEKSTTNVTQAGALSRKCLSRGAKEKMKENEFQKNSQTHLGGHMFLLCRGVPSYSIVGKWLHK